MLNGSKFGKKNKKFCKIGSNLRFLRKFQHKVANQVSVTGQGGSIAQPT
jgi:hypothetical protein